MENSAALTFLLVILGLSVVGCGGGSSGNEGGNGNGNGDGNPGAGNNLSSVYLKIDKSGISPPPKVVGEGSTVVGEVPAVCAVGADIRPIQIEMVLLSGKPTDIENVTFSNEGGIQVGSGSFKGDNLNDIVTIFDSFPSIRVESCAHFTYKIKLSQVRINQGEQGAHISIGIVSGNTQGVSGPNQVKVGAVGSAPVLEAKVFSSFPAVELVGLDSKTPSDKLLRFNVTAHQGGICIGSQRFGNQNSLSGGVTNIKLYAYTDSILTIPVDGFPLGKLSTGIVNSPKDVAMYFVVNTTPAVFIPEGVTYHFEINGTPSSIQNGSTMFTGILGDLEYSPMETVEKMIASGQNFVWSPAGVSTGDVCGGQYTNGYGVPGLPPGGLGQFRFFQ